MTTSFKSLGYGTTQNPAAMSKRTEKVRIIHVKPLHDPVNQDENNSEVDGDTETDKSDEAEETADNTSSTVDLKNTANDDTVRNLTHVDSGTVQRTSVAVNIDSCNIKQINLDLEVGEAKVRGDFKDVKRKGKKDKKRRKKTEKKKTEQKKDKHQLTKKKEISHDNDEVKEKKIPHRLPPIIQHKDGDLMKPQVQKVEKSGCCFGFISTWISKRKEKRRQKKRQAIERRNKTSGERLEQCEHKLSRGGEAFTVALDNKILTRKPVLPPIRPKSKSRGHINDRMDLVEFRRTEHLIKRQEAGAESDRRRLENAERKADMEYGYKTKAQLTIIAKQGQARRNKNMMDQERRCPSVLRRVPSTMPPASPISSDIVLE